MKRSYYSTRTGKNPKGRSIDLALAKTVFGSAYRRWTNSGYFQEHFGFECVDMGYVPGKLGVDIATELLFQIRKDNLWPIEENLEGYSEDDLFDVIEFLYDHISKPLEGHYHDFSGCGWHYSKFDAAAGRAEYRARTNELLEAYRGGYELSENGEILEAAQPGTEQLLTARIPSKDANISQRVDAAISKFRRHRSTPDERRDAVRDLADVLEYLRPKLKSVLTKQDEADLFNLANNFGVRHHNQTQKREYDQAIWLSWMFYFYLATIHACLRFIDKKHTS